MFNPFQRLAHPRGLCGLLLIVETVGFTIPFILFSQSTSTKAGLPKRSIPAKKPVSGNARIELAATAAFPSGVLKPVTDREFLLLAVDPDILKAQIEKEIPLPQVPPSEPKKFLSPVNQQQFDRQKLANEFKVSPGFVALAQKAPQEGASYRDEPRFRLLEDYAQVDELKKAYNSLLKKKVKKGNIAALSEDQKLELVKPLDIEFNRLPPADKTSIAIRMAQLAVERENQAFAERRQQIDRKNAVLARRTKRFEELLEAMETAKKCFRATSDPRGVSRFFRLPAGTYWAFADNFSFEGITTSWNIVIPLRRNEAKRIELMIGNN